MLYLRSINRFILISLMLLGLSVSTGASAKTFLVEFEATQYVGTETTSPYWQLPNTPVGATTLFDFTIEAPTGGGELIDDGTSLVIKSLAGEGGVSSVNLYDWGNSGQHDDILVTPTDQANIEIYDDDPRDGNVDPVGTFGFFWFDAPGHAGAPGAPVDSYTIWFWALSLNDGEDRMAVSGGGILPQEYLGNVYIREISAVPIPAAIWLFGTALIGLVGLSKRRKTV